ncbi:hypothetical protein BO95DRAFT_32001, partial [Aspergillus brunneoviolaceus CBS 621.78]
ADSLTDYINLNTRRLCACIQGLQATVTKGQNDLSRRYMVVMAGVGVFLDRKTKNMPKTYNRRDSLVVTHPTTNLPACGLSMAERTGSPIFHTLWSYVLYAQLQKLITLES